MFAGERKQIYLHSFKVIALLIYIYISQCLRLSPQHCSHQLQIVFLSPTCVPEFNSPAAQQNSEATAPTAGGPSQRSSKEQSARRKDEAKQAAKKPKENALSQFDLNNYASKKMHLYS